MMIRRGLLFDDFGVESALGLLCGSCAQAFSMQDEYYKPHIFNMQGFSMSTLIYPLMILGYHPA